MNEGFSKKTIFPKKSFLVRLLQWFYLLFGIFSLSLPFWYQRITFFHQFSLPETIVIIFGFVVALYCLLLSVAFFTQNSILLILSLVFIFFTTIAALGLLVVSLYNYKTFIHGLPTCYQNLALCSVKDGLAVASAFSVAASFPVLVLNLITIVGSIKALASGD